MARQWPEKRRGLWLQKVLLESPAQAPSNSRAIICSLKSLRRIRTVGLGLWLCYSVPKAATIHCPPMVQRMQAHSRLATVTAVNLHQS